MFPSVITKQGILSVPYLITWANLARGNILRGTKGRGQVAVASTPSSWYLWSILSWVVRTVVETCQTLVPYHRMMSPSMWFTCFHVRWAEWFGMQPCRRALAATNVLGLIAGQAKGIFSVCFTATGWKQLRRRGLEVSTPVNEQCVDNYLCVFADKRTIKRYRSALADKECLLYLKRAQTIMR